MRFEHIPAGFLHDIRDYDDFNRANSLEESGTFTDTIRGYSISQIFNQLHSGTTTAPQLVDILRNNRPIGNSLTNFNFLSSSYGY